jgi:hypothetical protein
LKLFSPPQPGRPDDKTRKQDGYRKRKRKESQKYGMTVKTTDRTIRK